MAYGSASRYDLEEDDDISSYRFGARRAGKSRALTGGRNIRVSDSSAHPAEHP